MGKMNEMFLGHLWGGGKHTKRLYASWQNLLLFIMENIIMRNIIENKACFIAIDEFILNYYRKYKKLQITRVKALNKRKNYYSVRGTLNLTKFRAKVVLQPAKKEGFILKRIANIPEGKVVDIKIYEPLL